MNAAIGILRTHRGANDGKIALLDQVLHARCVDEDFNGCGSATLHALNKALRNDRAQVQRKLHEDLFLELAGVEMENALQRERCVRGVQCCENEMACFRCVQRKLHGFGVANFADANHLRRLTKGILQGLREAEGVDANLALRDDGAPVGVHELDGVLNGDDVARAQVIAIIYE